MSRVSFRHGAGAGSIASVLRYSLNLSRNQSALRATANKIIGLLTESNFKIMRSIILDSPGLLTYDLVPSTSAQYPYIFIEGVRK